MSTGHFQKLPQNGKFMIGSIPEVGNEEITVEAQYNPKELQIESPVGWVEHKAIGHQSVATKPMEFTGMGVETVKVELVFDAYENNDDLVVERIEKLKMMARVRKPNHSPTNGAVQRPSYCVATWGTQTPFRCVIDSISVKYTMFATDGTPIRATVVLGLKSGCRTIDRSEETKFERSSRERSEAAAEARQKERTKLRDQATTERNTRDRADEAERAARYKASEADRRLAERESRVYAEQQEIAAARDQRQREAKAREQRIARERQVAADERQVAADRDSERAMREQRKKDLDLE
jgi:hypothetical protein